MRFPNKIALFVFFLLGTAAMLPAQNPSGGNLSGGFSGRSAGEIREKLFLHSDKTVYLAGETCWFSLYCLNASSHRPMAASRIAYIELLNRSGQAVLQTRTGLDSGFGAGNLIISTSLPSGRYQLRAYTAWMQNSPADYFFSQDITVINTLRGSGVDMPDSDRRPSVTFFPEGGQFVTGLPVRMACRVRDGRGSPLLTTLELRNQRSDRLAAAGTDSDGIARFELTPQSGDSLYATIMGHAGAAFPLPKATGAGYTLRLDRESRTLKISVHATASEENKRIYLVVHTRRSVKNLQTGRISGGASLFQVSLDSLDDGISVITLLDENRQPVSERLSFKSPERQMKIEAVTDSAAYSARSAVRLSFTATADGRPVGARLSASLFRLDTLQNIPDQNILNWLLLSSDLPGLPPGAGRFVGKQDPENSLILDNIMMTNGWRRYNSSQSASNPAPVLRFLPEIDGPVVRARVVNRVTGEPVPNVPYLLSIPGSKSELSVSTSDRNGALRFAVRSSNATEQLVLQPLHSADSAFRLEIDHAFSDSLSTALLPAIRVTAAATGDLTERHIAVQVQNSFASPAKKQVGAGTGADSISFYGVPDRHYHLDSYIRYVTMEEVLREFVDDVRIRKEANRFHFFVRNSLFNTFFENEPLILLDGVPVSDAGKIVALDPLKIRDIYVVTHRYYKGADDFQGIVAVRSYSGESGTANLDPGAVILDYGGLQQRREFYSPDYSDSAARQSPVPDYRTTLWWSPDLRTGSGGMMTRKLTTGDLPGRYALLVEGISAEGRAGCDVKIITVGPDR